MLESIALAKAIELQNRAREQQWRRKEDLFYLVHAREPLPFFLWLGRIFAAMRRLNRTIKKADRPETSRSARDSSDCRDQAACSRI